MAFRRLEELDVRGKRVLVREDLNVPFINGAIADPARIDAALPTLRWLHDRDARTIVLSHLGRPGGRPNPALSLRPVAQALADRLGLRVAFAEDCVGEPAARAIATMAGGDLLVLENVRFHPEEERDDPAFARRLAELGDLYVNDAFATAHRAHASTEGIAHLLPSAAGLLMEAELDALSRILKHPEKPFVCAIGGAKIKDKLGLLRQLSELVTGFCVGGGMANTLLAAQGVNVGRSLRDDDLEPARGVLDICKERGVALGLPSDAVVAPSLDASARARVVPIGDVGGEMILDIGPATARAYAETIASAKTILFNGPMGVYEQPAYRAGTQAVGDAIAGATARGAVSVVGGGDAAAAAHMLGFASQMTHVSTGGGATLEFLEGTTLPGVAALE
ncbi:MAG: phosphoglycerate kinase [Candidatus Eremiobacteraeota bacterium]|nr:phosphoglycerate kinase [Candidatus Eremiobacteraeota bacterium]MBV9698791.1 phosphoglycerate kinase [Candidatus Eremiobacteraeota bacterium]